MPRTPNEIVHRVVAAALEHVQDLGLESPLASIYARAERATILMTDTVHCGGSRFCYPILAAIFVTAKQLVRLSREQQLQHFERSPQEQVTIATFMLGQVPQLPLHVQAKMVIPSTLALRQADLTVTVQLLQHLRQRIIGDAPENCALIHWLDETRSCLADDSILLMHGLTSNERQAPVDEVPCCRQYGRDSWATDLE